MVTYFSTLLHRLFIAWMGISMAFAHGVEKNTVCGEGCLPMRKKF
jgi:hypothetical protein